MGEVVFSLPPVKEFRNHIAFCLGYVLGLAGYLDLQEEPIPMGLDWLDTPKVTELWNKLQEAGEDQPVSFSKKEVLLSYLCHDIMNKMLLTPEGERFSMIILKRVDPNYSPEAFQEYRSNSMIGNSHIMRNIESHLNEDTELNELKDQLAKIEI